MNEKETALSPEKGEIRTKRMGKAVTKGKGRKKLMKKSTNAGRAKRPFASGKKMGAKRSIAAKALKMSDIPNLLRAFDNRIKRIESALKIVHEPVSGTVSYKDFLNEKKPRNTSHKILGAGYYLEKHRGMKSFTAADIQDIMKTEKVAGAKNVTTKTVKGLKKKYISEVKNRMSGKRTWCLTKLGHKYVEKGFRK